MAVTSTEFQISILLSLFLISSIGVEGVLPRQCKHYECPNYDVIQAGIGHEIRRYNSSVFIATDPIPEPSLVKATKIGFSSLFSYINGNNNDKKKIKMTTPVTSEVSVSDDGKTSIVVSLYLPKKNQANPPPADGINVHRWKNVTAAVRQFGGFVTDSNVGQQIAALKASIVGTKWSANVSSSCIVAQYNSPFQLFNRVNEIWFLYKS